MKQYYLTDIPKLAMAVSYRVGEWARAEGISVRTLQRAVKKQFGQPPKKLLNRARLEAVEEEIKNGNAEKMIFDLFGFVDSAHLSRAFKNEFGRPPCRRPYHRRQAV